MWNKSLRLLATSIATFLLSLGMAAQAQATIVTLTPSSVSASIGDTVNFDLTVSDVTDLFGFQFSLQFDPNLINISGLTEGPVLSTAGTTFFVPGAFDNLGGFLELSGDTLIGPISGFTGSGVLASITFMAIGAGVGGIAVNDLFLLDSSFSEIASALNSATIEVKSAGSAIPEPATYVLVMLGLAIMARVRNNKMG